MSKKEEATIILDMMEDEGCVINWNFEQKYLDAIVKGLRKIELEKEDGNY